MPSYGEAFYDRAEQSAIAAHTIVPLLRSFVAINSVLDVGCARGTWLKEWSTSGCTEILGIDGACVRQDQLVIGLDTFVVADLAHSFSLGRRFDLVQCLEVAEHLPRERSRSLVADLVRHSDVVLFSAAPPGQGGEFHVNERPYHFWKALFSEQGYIAFDCLRPRIRHLKAIPFWYRYNMILYIEQHAVGKLNPAALAGRIDQDAQIQDIAPLPFRMQKALLRHLPSRIIDCLARISTRWR